ncbi:MAG: response regulator [Armatimonadetes bacterium]|nr:response regulator [Armatimonadota bacterium]
MNPEDKASILVVDDTPANLRLLSGMLKDEGYRVRPVPSGKLALKAADSDPPDLILLDINMPEMDGFETCRRLKADRRLREIPVIFISALTETMDKVKAFGCGGVDYVTKPFQFEEVLARVETHLTLRKLRQQLERHNRHLEELVAEQVRDIAASQLATILAMSKLAESRDDDTGHHIERTQTYCRMLAEQMRTTEAYAPRINERFVENIFHASPLHDIGKVAIPDRILCKPGRLDEEEYQLMKTHTTRGASTLAAVAARYPKNAFVDMGLEIALFHHERWDGKGYPRGRCGEDIPLSAQIMAVADVYDALTSRRCYKEAFSHEESRRIIADSSGTHFAPGVVEAFLSMEAEFDRVRQEMNPGVA